jgi:hypothetical protein
VSYVAQGKPKPKGSGVGLADSLVELLLQVGQQLRLRDCQTAWVPGLGDGVVELEVGEPADVVQLSVSAASFGPVM